MLNFYIIMLIQFFLLEKSALHLCSSGLGKQVQFQMVNNKNYSQINKIDTPNVKKYGKSFSNIAKHTKCLFLSLFDIKTITLFIKGLFFSCLYSFLSFIFQISIIVGIFIALNISQSKTIDIFNSSVSGFISVHLTKIATSVSVILIIFSIIFDMYISRNSMSGHKFNNELCLYTSDTMDSIKNKISKYKSRFGKNNYTELLEQIIENSEKFSSDTINKVDPVYLNSNYFIDKEEIINDMNTFSCNATIFLLACLQSYIIPIFSWIFQVLMLNIIYMFKQQSDKKQELSSSIIEVTSLQNNHIKLLYLFQVITLLLQVTKNLTFFLFYFFVDQDKQKINKISQHILDNYETIFYTNLQQGSKEFFLYSVRQSQLFELYENLILIFNFLIVMGVIFFIYKKNSHKFSQSLYAVFVLIKDTFTVPYSQANNWQIITVLTLLAMVYYCYTIPVFLINTFGIVLFYFYAVPNATKVIMEFGTVLHTLIQIIHLFTLISPNTTLLKNIKSWSNIVKTPLIDTETVPVDFSIDRICFSNTDLGYTENNTVISNINFVARKGEMVIIRGKSGEGKSTLLKGLMGDVYCNGGDILFCDKSNMLKSQHISNSYKQKLFGYCSQKLYFPSGTIKDFFHQYSKQLTDKKIYELLDQVELKNNIMTRDKKLDTDMGNNGAIFSGGQRARLYLAAILSKQYMINGTLFVILDETLDSVDNKTTEYIINVLIKQLKQEKICLICISHKTDEIIDCCIKNNIAYRTVDVKNQTTISKHHKSHVDSNIEQDDQYLNSIFGVQELKSNTIEYKFSTTGEDR